MVGAPLTDPVRLFSPPFPSSRATRLACIHKSSPLFSPALPRSAPAAAPRRAAGPARPGGTAGSGADPSLESDVSASQSSSQPTLSGGSLGGAASLWPSDARPADDIADSPLQDLRLWEAAVGLAVPDDLLVDRDGPRARYFSRRQCHFPQLATVKRRQQLLRKVRAPQQPLAARAVADDDRARRARWWWGMGVASRRVRGRARGGATSAVATFVACDAYMYGAHRFDLFGSRESAVLSLLSLYPRSASSEKYLGSEILVGLVTKNERQRNL